MENKSFTSQETELDNMCLSAVRLLQQNVTDWVAYKQEEFISRSFGGWNFKVKSPVGSVSCEDPLFWFIGSHLLSVLHMAEGGRGLSGASFI